jgi:hypothetical protein
MGRRAYLVPSNLPGNISNIRWTADIVIDRTNTSLGWKWSAATYTSFAAHAGLNIKPIDGNSQIHIQIQTMQEHRKTLNPHWSAVQRVMAEPTKWVLIVQQVMQPVP